ncbi:nitrate ABC transporter permease [Nibrella viscosa]|uniref:Nitrate ABC transporter permease n=1 Tax=Nibrella viscosa TaxID=1084524 RepID=A0ABP8KS76_9BACT
MKKIFSVSGALSIAYFIGSILLLLGLWSLVSAFTGQEIPGPAATWTVFYEMLQDPFYDYGPNDKGIGIQLWSSIKRVFSGFFIGSLVAIPLGLLMGASKTGMRLLNPLVQVLRPVSPLAWFPLGLLAFKASEGATVFIIAITSLWPTLINTAFGVSSIPQDFRNVGKAFGFSTWKYLTKILIPYALPHIITGLRLSIGIAWMVIVAGEMLSGGIGIGFFVWDSWNGLSLEKILSAILIIGIVGLLLDKLFNALQRFVAYEGK